MSRENYDSHVAEEARRPGTAASLADAGRFDWHRRICPVCGVSKYAYTRCPEGARLSKLVTSPAGESVISTRQVAPGGRSAALTTPDSLPAEDLAS